MRIPLIGGSYPAFSPAVSAQQSMNCYVETIETLEGKNKAVIRGRPGMRLFKDLTGISGSATPVRGLWSGGGRLFVAAGTTFFEIDSSGNLVGLTSTIYDDGTHSPVDIFPNGNQLFVVSAGLSYCDNGLGLVQNVLPALSGQCTTIGKLVLLEATPNGSTGNTDSFDVGMIGQTMTINGTGYTVASLTNPSMLQLTTSAGLQSFHDWSSTPVLNAVRGAFQDSYFIVNRPQSRQWNISNLLDGSTWAGLDFALKEGYPDNIAAVWAEAPFLYLLGTETLELWRDTGAASFPFERVDGGFARVGLAATWSPCSIMGKLHMLAGGTYGQTVAVRMEGTTPVRISNHAVEEALAAAGALAAEGVSYSYLERGHWNWVVNFAGNTDCWVYDATESAIQGTPQWHQRALWDPAGKQYLPYKPWFHTFIPEWGANGQHIVGDYNSGKLYVMDSAYFDDDGADIRAQRALAYVYNEGKRVFHHRIEIEMETGTAGTPPVVTLDWSDDRGETFGTAAGVGTFLTLGPGLTGEFTTRYYAVGLGSSRGRIYRLTIQGQGRIAVIDATLEATMGVT